MKTSDFDYDLPSENIAQTPIEPRDAARLLVLDRETCQRTHTQFDQLFNFLNSGDLLVLNRSRVIPARLHAHKLPGGGKVELLMLERLSPVRWKSLVGGKRLSRGVKLELENGMGAVVTQEGQGALRVIEFDTPLDTALKTLGKVPLPPYIKEDLSEPNRYQTVYAQEPGSAAAPTAGLHFTSQLIDHLKMAGIAFTELLLHIGLDTFAPVHEENPKKHLIHTEWCKLSSESARAINAARLRNGRIVAVGTTSVRVLESAALRAANRDVVAPFEGPTDLFILPGHRFRAVDAMITNFHLPRSTLLMLVSAFAGRDLILETYRQAINREYRFYSFGDAMFIA